MKQLLKKWTTILFIIIICKGCNQLDSHNDLVKIDVTTKYPLKKLILQDFMDVEYIALETREDFLCQGLLKDVGKNHIIVINRNGDGDIFIFDRNSGKALKKINRKGQGGEEYTGILTITLDEDNGELFVNDYSIRKIIVYDLEGNYKRSFKHQGNYQYGEIYNFDQKNLICHDVLNENTTKLSLTNTGQSFMIISKQDGSIAREIQIPFEEKKSIVMKHKDETSGITYAYLPPTVHPLVPSFNNWMLVELSADTVYNYSSDHQLTPVFTRTPSVQSINPEVFLFLSMVTDRYCFMGTIKKESGFPDTDLLYDKYKKAIFRYIVYNGDYSNEEEAFLKSFPVNNEIPSRQILDTYKIMKDYEKGVLKGKLKEIAANLNEESNPVIMLIKHKSKVE